VLTIVTLGAEVGPVTLIPDKNMKKFNEEIRHLFCMWLYQMELGVFAAVDSGAEVDGPQHSVLVE
jgi:hypothetical protein